MTQYSQEFKDNIIQQMLPPVSKSVRQHHNETGVSEQTLFKWKREAKASGMATPSGSGTSETWSSEDKFLIVLETVRMNQAELAEYCREKGLYVEQIASWKDACISANGNVAQESQQLRKDLNDTRKQMNQINRELKRKEAALAETAALLVLRKKAQAVWGEPEDE